MGIENMPKPSKEPIKEKVQREFAESLEEYDRSVSTDLKPLIIETLKNLPKDKLTEEGLNLAAEKDSISRGIVDWILEEGGLSEDQKNTIIEARKNSMQ